MVEILLFTLVGILLYIISDRLLVLIENRMGKTLNNRSVVFFVIFLSLALASFEILGLLLKKPG